MHVNKTIILALILTGFLLYIFKVELPSEEETIKREKVFHDLVPGQLKAIEIKNEKGTFTLENLKPVSKEDAAKGLGNEPLDVSQWRIKELPQARLDRATVDSFVSALFALKPDSSIEEKDLESDLGVYGLKDPTVVIRLDADGQQMTVKLGKKNDYVAKRYVKVEGVADKSDLGLYPDTLMSLVNKPRDDFRHKNPVEFVDNDLQEVKLTSNSQVLQFKRGAENKWDMSEPFQCLASTEELTSLFRELRALHASEFVDGADFAKLKLDKPDYRAVLVHKDGTKQELSLSVAPKDKEIESAYFTLGENGAAYKMLENPLKKLFKPAEQYREKKLFVFPTESVKKANFTFVDADGIVLERTGAEWTVNGKKGDPVFVKQVLDNLAQLSAVDFPNENRDAGFAKPRLKVELEFQAGTKPEKRTLVVGTETRTGGSSEPRFFAGVDELTAPFIINEADLKRITPHEEALLKAEPTPIPEPTAGSGAVTEGSAPQAPAGQ